jgi:ssDNA-binding Zn-finger/Zn-ribbon topoisomerase 1
MNRKEYDRKRAQKLYGAYQERRKQIYQTLGNQCACCHDVRVTYHLHHVSYHPEQSNYPKHAKSQWVREQRLREAESHPARFQLLCPRCHRSIESLKQLVKNPKTIPYLLSIVGALESKLNAPR